MRSDFSLLIDVDVRWGDMDARGHVNNSAYFTYCEMARLAYFERIEIGSFGEGKDEGQILVSATCNFRRQLVAPAEIEVGMRVTELRNRSFHSAYEIFLKGTDTLVADGTAVSVWMDYKTDKAIPMPEALRDAISKMENGKVS